MIVLIIIGVLCVVAINQFSGSKESALQREAATNLKLIAAAEKIYRMEIGGFVNSTSAHYLNQNLSLMLPEVNPSYTYSVTCATATDFTAEANRSPGAPANKVCINASAPDTTTVGCP